MSTRVVHILRYGTVAEKAHLEKAISAYDYLSINGNTAAYVSTAIAGFVVDKFFTKPDKGFFIDPITYAFQKEIRLLKSESKATGEKKIKKSVEKLIDKYGYPVDKVRKDVSIEPSDFRVDADKEPFCRRVLDFQYNLVNEHLKENDLEKYLDYVAPNGTESIPQFRPKFLIAPYFFLDLDDSNYEQWLGLNLDFIKIAAQQAQELFDGCPVFAQIVISKSLFENRAKLDGLAEAYNHSNCNGITIWVDDLNEHESSYQDLRGFVYLLQKLHGTRPIYNMYGGYFSVLLTNKRIQLLNGVSHGLEYGESRKVYPVGGGIPVSKYYFYPLHQRLDFTKAFYLLEHTGAIDISLDNWGSPSKYYHEVCRCGQCQKIIKEDMINFVEFESKDYYEIRIKDRVQRRKKASSDTKENCLYHYLLCKKKEFLRVGKNSLADLLADLATQKEQYTHCTALVDGELDYMDTWQRVLKG